MTNEIDRPIFVVGCGRSGTTLLYQMLATHPDVGWISNYSERWPNMLWLNAFSPLYRGPHERSWLRRVLPQPSEGDKVWDLIAGAGRPINGGPVTAAFASEAVRGRAHTLLQHQLDHQNRSRFLNKNTENTCRVGYLDAVFPDCVIVHVIRNPNAVVESLLRVDWWQTLRAWPFGGTTPRAWVKSGGREEVMAATLWRRETELAIDGGNTLGDHRYLEVRYEDLVRDPTRVIRTIADFAALPWSPTFERRLGTFDVRATAATRSSALEVDQLAAIAEIVEPLAGRLGYADLTRAGDSARG